MTTTSLHPVSPPVAVDGIPRSIARGQEPPSPSHDDHRPAMPSSVRLLFTASVAAGMGVLRLAGAFHDWLGGPALTDRERQRSRIAHADCYRAIWSGL